MSKKLFLSKRSMFFFVFLSIVGACFVFKGSIFHFALKKYVSHKISLKGDWDFNYSYISLVDSGIAFHDINLSSKDGGPRCKIAKIFCKAPVLENISFSNHFVIDGLDVTFEKKIGGKGTVSSDQMRSILSTLLQVEITSGVIHIPGRECLVTLGKSISPQKLGKIVFSKEGEGQVKLDLSMWADQWIVDVEARQSGVAFYKTFADFFLGGKISDWKIKNGKLDGSAFFAVSSTNVIKDARVHMSCLEGKFTNDTAGINSSFNRIFVDMNYPVATDSEGILSNIKIISSVDKGEINVLDEKGNARFSFKDLSGYFTMDAFKEAAVEISGFIEDKDRLLPIQLAGKPISKNEKGLEVDLSLQLDPVFGHQAHVNVVCSHSDDTFFIKSRLDSLQVRQMLILQVGLGLFDPGFKDYTISKGRYSGDLEMEIGYEGIKDFSLKNLLCEDLGIYSEKRDTLLEAKRVSGQCQIDLFKDKTTSLTSWEMKLTEGSMVIGREGTPPYHLEKGEIDITVCDREFSESYFTSEINGVKGRVVVEGTMDEPTFDIVLSAGGDDALKWLADVEKSYNTDLILTAKIDKQCKEYSGFGDLTFINGKEINSVQFTTFGTSVSDMIVDFSAQKFSGSLFPLLNEITKFRWSVDGEYAFTGRYAPDQVYLDVEGENCTYRKEHSYIKDAAGKAHYRQNLHTGDWYVDIALKKGKKKLLADQNFFLENVEMRISSDSRFFMVRGLEGNLEMGRHFAPMKVRANKFDLSSDGSIDFDLAFNNSEVELIRLAGAVKEREVFFDSNTHFLDEGVECKKCTFKEGLEVAMNWKLSLQDVCFPKVVRDLCIDPLICDFTFDQGKYLLKCNNDLIHFALDGTGKEFTIKCNDSTLNGIVDGSAIRVQKGVVRHQKKLLRVSSFDINADTFCFVGGFKDDRFYFNGNVVGNFQTNLVLEGKAMGGFVFEDPFVASIDSLEEFSFTYDGKWMIHNGNFAISDSQAGVCEVRVKSIGLHDQLEKISLHGIKGLLSNTFLFEKLGVQVAGETIEFSAEADILPLSNDFWFSAMMGGQKFVLLDRKVSAENIHVRGNKKAIVIDCDLPLFGSNIELKSHVFLDERLNFRVDGKCCDKKVLLVDGRYDGEFEIFRMKGDLLGVAFDLTPANTVQENAFKAEMSLDLQRMKPILPEGVVEFVDRLSLGKGIDVIGELYFKNGVCFDGLIKGTDFDFVGCCLSSLFGTIQIENGICTLNDFSIADRSMIANCRHAVFDTTSSGCQLEAKKFEIKNLRPCLMSKKGERNKLSNPFMIEKLEFLDLKGDLADISTLTGKGGVRFTNAFDKRSNPVIGFAKEIIGRIGLDPVLMIPVVGEIDFLVGDGKLNFIKMQNSYSDMGRSYFYLWNKSQSFIDFDGNIHIDIRMKQYVLFKFAELFVISLDGPISSPKVHLK